jgi:hypothetical protein
MDRMDGLINQSTNQDILVLTLTLFSASNVSEPESDVCDILYVSESERNETPISPSSSA